MTRLFPLSLFLAVLASATANAQTTNADAGDVIASGSVWLDLFLGPDGDVIYPQYAFRVTVGVVTATGYGFLERAPGEPLFTNHVNTATWSQIPQFSVRTETGGRVLEFIAPESAGGPIPPGAFFQLGPQVNLHQLGRIKGLDYLVLSYLPHLAGIRPDNTILAGGTTRLPITQRIVVSVEGYRRFFPDGADYAEYWFLVHPARFKGRASFGAFFLQDGKAKSLGFGTRLGPL